MAAVALVAAGTVVTAQQVGGEQQSPSTQADAPAPPTDSDPIGGTPDGSSDDEVSRSGDRDALDDSTGPSAGPADGAGTATVAAPEPAGSKYVTTELNVRTGPGEQYDVLTVLPTGAEVTVTDETRGVWAEIIRDGESRWVTAEYLANEKPEVEPESGALSDAPCSTGSSVESGLTPDAILVHRAVCAEFPEVTSYGGLRPGDPDEHGTGQALDIMISGSTGDAIAEFVQANASELGVSEVLWEQQIWTVQRASEGWRWMPDLGSITANHYDHVHVTVYGTSGG